MRLSAESQVVMVVVAAMVMVMAPPTQGSVVDSMECALRILALQFSQSLLLNAGGGSGGGSGSDRGAVRDLEVASALRLSADCGYTVPRRATTTTPAAVPPPRYRRSVCSVHVATTGNDTTGTGSLALPVATLERAQRAVRATRSSPAALCSVYVHTGVYYLERTLVLTAEDSNTEWIAVGNDVTLSGGVPLPVGSFSPSASNPSVLEASVAGLNLTTVTPRGSTGGPANRLFVDDVPMIWARYPDAPPTLPECALKVPLGRVGLATPPRVGFMKDALTPSWDPAVVANYSWIIPTVGPHPRAYYAEPAQHITVSPNWSTPSFNGGVPRPGWANKPVIDGAGETPCYWDAAGGPFARFTPAVAHGAPRTRTVSVAPVGVALAAGSPFSSRMREWSEVEWGVVQSMHWWHAVECAGDVDGPNATGTVDCTSIKTGAWPGSAGRKPYGGPGPGDGYWGAWAWQIESVDATARRIRFGSGGSQTTRGALNAGPWYVEGIKEELTAPGEWVHSVADDKVYLYPNATGPSSIVVASLEQLVAVRGEQDHPVVGVRIAGFKLRHSASHYTGPYPTCGGGDLCAARTGTVVITGGENITLSGLDIDHPRGNAIAILDYNRGVDVSNCSLRHVGEMGFVVEGQTDGIDATKGNYPVGTRIHHNFVYEVATKMRGGCAFFQSLAALTEFDHNVALNGPRAGINFNDGMGGGNNVHHNLVGNFVRESADHGNENSWDRVPFLSTFRNGTASLVPRWSRNHHNFWLLPNFGQNIDHDDGSAYYNDSYNVILGGGGWNKHSGPYQMAIGNLWITTSSDERSAQCGSEIAGQSNTTLPFAANVCIGNWSGVSELASTPNSSYGNTFFTPSGNVTVNGLPLGKAQAAGLEPGSTEHPLATLPTEKVLTLVKALLGM